MVSEFHSNMHESRELKLKFYSSSDQLSFCSLCILSCMDTSMVTSFEVMQVYSMIVGKMQVHT